MQLTKFKSTKSTPIEEQSIQIITPHTEIEKLTTITEPVQTEIEDTTISTEVSTTNEELVVKDEVKQEIINVVEEIQENIIYNAMNKVVQSGYQNLTSLEKREITPQIDSRGNVALPPTENQIQYIEPLPTDIVNKYKTQWKSGYQTQADKSLLNGRELLELKEVQDPAPIKLTGYQSNIAYSNANGHNGYNKIELMKSSGVRQVVFDN